MVETDDYEGKDRRKSEHWHLDKRVPISIIVAIIAQTAGIIYGAALLRSDVDESKRRITALEHKDEKNGALGERVVRVETLMEGVKGAVERIEQKIDRAQRR